MPKRKGYKAKHYLDYPCHYKVWEVTDMRGRVTRVISPRRKDAVALFCERMNVSPEDFPLLYTVKRRTESNTCFKCGCLIADSEALCSICKEEMRAAGLI